MLDRFGVLIFFKQDIGQKKSSLGQRGIRFDGISQQLDGFSFAPFFLMKGGEGEASLRELGIDLESFLEMGSGLVEDRHLRGRLTVLKE